MIEFFRKASLKNKLLYSSIVITVIPMLVLVAFFVNQSQNTTYDWHIERTNNYADQLIQNFTSEIEKAEIMANSLVEYYPLEEYLYTDFDNTRTAFAYYEEAIHPIVTGYNNSKSGMRIRIYHHQDVPNFSVELNNQLDQFIEDHFETNPFSKHAAFWAHLECRPLDPVLCYFSAKRDEATLVDTAYVVSIQLKEKVFYSYIKNEDPDNSLILLMDQFGNILTSNDRQYARQKLQDLDPSLTDVKQLMNSEEISIGNKHYVTINRSSDVLRMSILVPQSLLQEELFQSMLTILFLGIFLIAISSFLVYFSTQQSLAGVDRLIRKMRNVNRNSIHHMAKDTFDENSKDEIAQLDHAFTTMMGQIDDLMGKIKSDELRWKDEIIARQQAELDYLQHQINPHYMFNTLESIRMNLVLKNDFETANVIKIFAGTIRRYMNMKEQHTSLLTEMDFIEKYIFIQNYRMEKKIDYCLEASETVLSHQILKLLIQPIVENSIIHGFETTTDNKIIRVTITKQADLLHIAVLDNGSGISAEDLADLRKYIYSIDDRSSVGLRNVYLRIKLAYGDRANLLISSTEGVGTEVTLIVPAISGKVVANKDVSSSFSR